MKKRTLKVLTEVLNVYRFPRGTRIPTPDDPTSFFCVTFTDEETSVVCNRKDFPNNESNIKADAEEGWRAFRIEGELDFSLVGILSEISSILAEGKISLFAVSTFNTDYFLVKQPDLERSLELLGQRHYDVTFE